MHHEQVVKQFILAEFLPDMTPEQLDHDADLVATGVIDSLGLLKLLAWLEERFGVQIDDLESPAEHLRSVATIEALVARTVAGSLDAK